MYFGQLSPIVVRVFVSHSWAYSEHYERLSGWLFDQSRTSDGRTVVFADNSVPKDNPIHFAPNDLALFAAISERIAQSNVVVIPTGMYASHSKWIKKEIEAAQLLRRPILAVNPWGQQRTSSVVAQAATELVGWNQDSVVHGVWRLYHR